MTSLELPLRAVVAGFGAYRAAFVDAALTRGLSQPRPVRRTGYDLPVTVQTVTETAQGVRAFELRSLDGAALPVWRPGAHVDVTLPSGLVRQYSLCGDPADRHSYRIAVRRLADGRGGSCEMHDLAPGSQLSLRGPRNAFRFVPAQRHLFVAGGIGITAIAPMVREASQRGLDWQLVYVGRSAASMPFVDELSRHGDRVQLWPTDQTGRPDLAELLARLPGGASVHVCGPETFMDAVRTTLTALDRTVLLYAERFSPAPVRGGEPLTVRLGRSDTTVSVAADESVLTAVRRHRPDVAYSCQQGFCGSCTTAVLAGTVEGRPVTSTRICVDRGDGLVLDL